MAEDYQILRIDQVSKLIGLGRSSIYKKIRLGEFPKAVELTPRARGWRLRDVREYVTALKVAS